MITDPEAAPAIGTTITNPIGVTPVAVGTMTSATMIDVKAAGSVTPRVIRKRRDVAGNVQIMAKADGLATAKVIPKPHAVVGNVLPRRQRLVRRLRRPFGSGPPRLGRGSPLATSR